MIERIEGMTHQSEAQAREGDHHHNVSNDLMNSSLFSFRIISTSKTSIGTIERLTSSLETDFFLTDMDNNDNS